VTVRNLLETSLRTWAPPGMLVSAEKWVALMRQPRTWIGQGFMAMAADAHQVEVRYYTVRGDERICTDSLKPGGGRQPLTCLRLALELEQHYRAIQRVDESKTDATADKGAGALDDDAMPLGTALLVPTESRWQMLLEESAELARESGMAAVSAEEFEGLMAAVHVSEQSTPPSTVALAMQRSLQDLQAEEARQATRGAQGSVRLTAAPHETDQFSAAQSAEQTTVATREAERSAAKARGRQRGATNEWRQPTRRSHRRSSRASDSSQPGPSRPRRRMEAVKARAKRLARDKTSGRISATELELLEMATAVAKARADGVNPRTSSKGAFALREFEAYAALRGDPNLRSEWARQFPERIASRWPRGSFGWHNGRSLARARGSPSR
jgi:hypothetical protein